MKIQFVIISVLVLLVVSCNKNKTSQPLDTSITFIKSLNSQEELSVIPPSFDQVTIVPLETNDDILIGNIDKIQVNDSLIFVSDSDDKLFVFDRHGRFRNMIGTIGMGPGEYRSLSTFFIDDNSSEIVIVDNVKSSFRRHGFDGKFHSRIRIDRSQFSPECASSHGDFVLLNNSISPENEPAYLLYNDKGETVFSKPYSGFSVSGYMMTFSRNSIAKTDDGQHFIMPFCDTIFQCKDDSVIPKYIIEHSKKMATIENYKLNREQTMLEFEIQSIKDGLFTGFKDIFETDRHILLNCGWMSGYSKEFNISYFLVDKKTDTGLYYLYDDESISMPFLRINASDGKNFVSIVPAYKLLPFKGKIDATNDENLEKFKTGVENLDEEDNPVLFFYKLK
ncbi:MAG: 6-bladed beta-propeller [Dysgonamonadaceae bacterium]|jgi:hypothetical protein|nr:6-bladed beta-propeller [Dysgonamonadaceae bacterium]